MTTLQIGYYLAMGAGSLVILCTLYVILAKKELTIFTATVLLIGSLLTLAPISENFKFSAGKDGVSAEFSAAEAVGGIKADNSSLEKRLDQLELSLANMAGRSEADGEVPSLPPSTINDHSVPSNNGNVNSFAGVPLYEYKVVVLYNPKQKANGELIAKALDDIGYAVGDQVADFSGVKNQQAPNTVRIIYDADKSELAKEVRSQVEDFIKTAKLNLKVVVHANGFNVSNGDVQLQIY